MNQQNALFVFSLFKQLTSTCFEQAYCSSSGGTILCIYWGADKSLARPRRKQAAATEDFDFHISYIIGVLLYITRLASNEIFSPSNKIHREVDLPKHLSAPLYSNWYMSCVYVDWLFAGSEWVWQQPANINV